jgi:branched-chain amino acid transport system substrate-binding protein
VFDLSRVHPFVYVEALLIIGGLCLTTICARGEIVVGLAGPMTGANAGIGVQLRTGAEAAIADINDHGGVLGQKLVLRTEDDACDPKRALQIAQKFNDDGVLFVLGHFCSAATLPASSIYADAGTVEITFSSNSRITEQGFGGLFRIAGRDDRQGQLLADFVAQHYPHARVALVADRSAYAVGLADTLRHAIPEGNLVTLAADLSVDAGQSDFSAVLG